MQRTRVPSNTIEQLDNDRELSRQPVQSLVGFFQSASVSSCCQSGRLTFGSGHRSRKKTELRVRHQVPDREIKRQSCCHRLAGFDLGEIEFFSLGLGAALWIVVLIVGVASSSIRTGGNTLINCREADQATLNLMPRTSANWKPLTGPPQQVAALQDLRAVRLSEEEVPLVLNNMPEGFDKNYRLQSRFSPVPQ
jgi:hypothetical protein